MNEPFLAAVPDPPAGRRPARRAAPGRRGGPDQPWPSRYGTALAAGLPGRPALPAQVPRSRPGPGSPRWEPTARLAGLRRTAPARRPADADLFLWALKAAVARLAAADDRRARRRPRRRPPGDPPRPAPRRLPAGLRRPPGRGPAPGPAAGGPPARIAAIPEAERSPALRRAFETLLAIDLNLILARGDAPEGPGRLGRPDPGRRPPRVQGAGDRPGRPSGQLAGSPPGLGRRPPQALRDRGKPPEADPIADELKRVEAASQGDPTRPPAR